MGARLVHLGGFGGRKVAAVVDRTPDGKPVVSIWQSGSGSWGFRRPAHEKDVIYGDAPEAWAATKDAKRAIAAGRLP